jgi:hypothetical protein
MVEKFTAMNALTEKLRLGKSRIMKDYHNLVESGRREIYTVEG